MFLGWYYSPPSGYGFRRKLVTRTSTLFTNERTNWHTDASLANQPGAFCSQGTSSPRASSGGGGGGGTAAGAGEGAGAGDAMAVEGEDEASDPLQDSEEEQEYEEEDDANHGYARWSDDEEEDEDGADDPTGLWRSRGNFPIGGGQKGQLLLMAVRKSRDLVFVTRPNSGRSPFEMTRHELHSKYVRVERGEKTENCRAAWQHTYNACERRCIHGPDCKSGGGCTVGQRKADVALLSGAILPVWTPILKVVRDHGRHLPKHEQALRVCRVTTDDGQRMAGIK